MREVRCTPAHIAILSRMRLYLSSYRLGDQPHQLPDMLAAPGPAAVIGNALDAVTVDARERAVDFEITALAGIGIDAEEFDLRDYFRHPRRCAERLARYRMVWLRGGTCSCCGMRWRAAAPIRPWRGSLCPTRSSTPVTAPDAAYSSRACAGWNSSTLRTRPSRPTARHPRWDGLGLLPYAIVPHHRSVHPESNAAELVAKRYQAEGVPHRTIRDGHAIVVNS